MCCIDDNDLRAHEKPWAKLRRQGTPLNQSTTNTLPDLPNVNCHNATQYIEARVEKIPECGCWIWMNCLDRDGYGILDVMGLDRSAHRAAYEAFHGPIADGLQIDHLCNVRACVNPVHLEAVTPKENSIRTVKRGNHKGWAKNLRKPGTPSHCKYGHAFTPENTGHRKDGKHFCKACRTKYNESRLHRTH